MLSTLPGWKMYRSDVSSPAVYRSRRASRSQVTWPVGASYGRGQGPRTGPEEVLCFSEKRRAPVSMA
eukprot:432541-Prymnesium_polylepis.1